MTDIGWTVSDSTSLGYRDAKPESIIYGNVKFFPKFIRNNRTTQVTPSIKNLNISKGKVTYDGAETGGSASPVPI
jgi:hypothetical protein